MNFSTKLLAAAVSACGTALLLVPLQANGASRRVHSTACAPERDNYGAWVMANAHALEFDFTSARVVRCPVPSDSNFSHNTAVTLNVHGERPGSDAQYSRACVTDWASGAAACGTNKSWGTGFTGAIGVDLSQWHEHDMWWYPYVRNEQNPTGSLFGFFIQS